MSMDEKNLYIISGCNGAGKTTASYTILPYVLECNEFVNADEIARGLSPFNVESVSIEAGRLMLDRIETLLTAGKDFAIETTLAARSHYNLVKRAQALGYKVSLIYFWLNTTKLAKRRIALRVEAGGHNIPDDVVERRYWSGLKNLFDLYMPVVDFWLIVDNSNIPRVAVAEGDQTTVRIHDLDHYKMIKSYVER